MSPLKPLPDEEKEKLQKGKWEPEPEPLVAGTSVFEVNAVCSSKGLNGINFTTTPGSAINNPNAQFIVTELKPIIFDQFVVGQQYKIEVKTTV